MPEDRERMLRRKKAYSATEEEKNKRVVRNKARRAAIRSGKAKVGDGTEVDHIRPLSKGGSATASNTRLVKKATNRAHGLAKRPKGTSRYL